MGTAPLASRRPNPPSEVRLHKYLADCGVASRRACEALIADGAVQVDGVVVIQQGLKLDPAGRDIRVHGKPVRTVASRLYFAFHKPRNVVSTSSDPQGRPTALDYFGDLSERVYTVGRLDFDSEGLLLLTNDGDFALALTHPRHGLPKVYHVWLDAELRPEDKERLLAGVSSRGEMLRAAEVAYLRITDRGHLYRMVLLEGKNRQIRRMVEAVGRTVQRLVRVAIGPVELAELRPGGRRPLTEGELDALRRWTAGSREASRPSRLG